MAVLISLVVSACGGGSDPAGQADGPQAPTSGQMESPESGSPGGLVQNPSPDTGVIGVVGTLSTPSQPVPSEIDALEQVSLSIDAGSRCSVAGDGFDVSISRAPTDGELEDGVLTGPQDVSAYVTLIQSLGNSLALESQGDGVVRFRQPVQDIVSLTAELDNGSVTAYLASFAADTPESVILKKPVPGGCLYALRLPDYCATGIAKGGMLTFRRGEQGISAMGCELSNPAAHPVIELPAPVQ